MTTPLERVERLRAETAKATATTWRQDEWRVIEEDHEAEVAEVDGPYWVADGNCAHIARWDPEATGKVLDMLESILAGRTPGVPTQGQALALDVLDALDPQEAT